MAVNLTARQFYDEHLLPDLTAILADTGMDAHLLELEITESLLMRDVEKTLRILTGLKDMGIRIAIDDFGIGYSSLATLKRFPLDTIKIDRSFIRDVASVAEDKELTEAIIAMGRTLSLTVVAQGVETKEQADFLRQNACDEFQGFYLNRPLPADQITELLRTQADVSGYRHKPRLPDDRRDRRRDRWAGLLRDQHFHAAIHQVLLDVADGIRVLDEVLLHFDAVRYFMGGWPRPVKMIFDQCALICAGDLPVNFR